MFKMTQSPSGEITWSADPEVWAAFFKSILKIGQGKKINKAVLAAMRETLAEHPDLAKIERAIKAAEAAGAEVQLLKARYEALCLKPQKEVRFRAGVLVAPRVVAKKAPKKAATKKPAAKRAVKR